MLLGDVYLGNFGSHPTSARTLKILP